MTVYSGWGCAWRRWYEGERQSEREREWSERGGRKIERKRWGNQKEF